MRIRPCWGLFIQKYQQVESFKFLKIRYRCVLVLLNLTKFDLKYVWILVSKIHTQRLS